MKYTSAQQILDAFERELEFEKRGTLEELLGFRLNEWLNAAIETYKDENVEKVEDAHEEKTLEDFTDDEITESVKERCEWDENFTNEIRDIVIAERDNLMNGDNSLISRMKIDFLSENLDKISLEQLESLLNGNH